MIKKTIKKIRGKYKKKKRIILSTRERTNAHLTHDILHGMTFEAAAEEYNINSAQAVQKRFRLTVINFFSPYQQEKIIKKDYDIKYLRKIWADRRA